MTLLLREATPEDAMAVAHVHVRSWQIGYRDLLPGEYLGTLRAEERARRYEFSATDPRKPRTVVAADSGVIVGFSTVAPARDKESAGCGELCALYVDPQFLGQANRSRADRECAAATVRERLPRRRPVGPGRQCQSRALL